MRYRGGGWCEAFLILELLRGLDSKEQGSIEYHAMDPYDEDTFVLATVLVQLGELHCFRQKSHCLLELRIDFKHHAIRAVVTPE
jgi:hypothetical protein